MHMGMRKIDAKGQEGIALMLTLFFLFSLSAMVTVMASRVMGQHRAVSTYVNYQNCFQGLEAGIAHAKAELFLGLNDDKNKLADELTDGRIGVSVHFVLIEGVFKLTEGVPTFEDTDIVTPGTSETLPQLEYFAYSFDWGSDKIDNNGDGFSDVDPDYEDEDGYYSIVVHSRMNNVSRSAEIVLKAANVNVWQNAIFAGQGQGGGVIEGNVSIHGSVHILGENLLPGDEAINALALSGGSIIANSYWGGGGSGLTDELRDRVPAPERVDFMGETDLETVKSVVRVKNGSVSLSGSANLGLENDDTNDRKESLDAVYINNNWTNTDAEGLPANVFSDNGSAADYDLGDAVDFPTFLDDRGDSHLEFYLEDFALDNSADHQIFDGDIALKAGVNDFYWNATTGDLVYTPPVGVPGLSIGTPENGAPFPNEAAVAALPAGDNYLWFDASERKMVIHGRIPVSGDILILSGSGEHNRVITYSGVGSLLAYDGGTGRGDGDVTITTSLVTPEATTDADGNPIPTFPDNVIGIMAADDLTIGGFSNLELMGGFYAQDAILIEKQSTIMGTIVANTFELTQVPDVYQVIPLAAALTRDAIRMIGSEPVILLIKVSWRELGVG